MSTILPNERKVLDTLRDTLAVLLSDLREQEGAIQDLMAEVRALESSAAKTEAVGVLLPFCQLWLVQPPYAASETFYKKNFTIMGIFATLNSTLIMMLHREQPTRIAEASPFAQRVLEHYLLKNRIYNEKLGTCTKLEETFPYYYLYAGVTLFYAGTDHAKAEEYIRVGLRHIGRINIEGPIWARAVLVKALRAQGKEEAANNEYDKSHKDACVPTAHHFA
ncbi:hypothetical protein RQP46_008538 [Phenoliferia psychrophenolica]